MNRVDSVNVMGLCRLFGKCCCGVVLIEVLVVLLVMVFGMVVVVGLISMMCCSVDFVKECGEVLCLV